MEVSEHVLSAGRAVLDMVEREWQPLSAGELEQRLDQAVEEILEADLMAKLKAQQPSPTIYVQLLQSQTNVQPQVLQTTSSSAPEEEIPEPRELLETVDGAAVKVTLSVCSLTECYCTCSKFTNLSKGVKDKLKTLLLIHSAHKHISLVFLCTD